MFWIILVVLSLLAIAFAAWPLWRESHRLSPLVAAVIVFTVGLSAIMYNHVGSPGVQSGRNTGQEGLPGMDEAIASLEARLEQNPEDPAGWSMLGRTYGAIGNFPAAVEAYEKALEIEDGRNAQTMVDLAVAIVNRDQTPIVGRAEGLVESALALEPNNPAALFYSGLALANKGDTDTAADRWEVLLGLNPPENIRGILEENIAQWRGESPPMPAAHPPINDQAADVPADAVVSARVSLSVEAQQSISGNANVFIIARDPAAPSPPIAVTRMTLSELPSTVSLSDANSMVAGRDLSGFAEIEIVARVSLSGGPAAASGDWFGSLILRPAETPAVELTINQQVP